MSLFMFGRAGRGIENAWPDAFLKRRKAMLEAVKYALGCNEETSVYEDDGVSCSEIARVTPRRGKNGSMSAEIRKP